MAYKRTQIVPQNGINRETEFCAIFPNYQKQRVFGLGHRFSRNEQPFVFFYAS